MNTFQAIYCPIGVPTFHLESAQVEFEKSVALLKSLSPDIICPDKMLLTMPDLEEFLASSKPDFVILQNITFANGAYASAIASRFDCPVLLWTLREPVIDGGRLRLNSLTGAYSAANAMRGLGITYEYIFGSPEEASVADKISVCLKAARLKKSLCSLKMASIGQTPQGFGFGRAADLDLLRTFGVTLESLEVREMMEKARTYSDEDCAEDLKEAQAMTVGLDQIPEQNVRDFAKVYKAYKDYALSNGIGAISSRCWPDFFLSYGTAVCSVISLMNDLGIPASCESDTYGSLSMYMCKELTGMPTFFGDPVSMDEAENTITFWHCGMGASKLARKDTGAQIGVHPNRKIGPAMDFGCVANDTATIFRVGRDADGSFRFFVATGEILDKPKQFTGTSLVVRTDSSAAELVNASVADGWEPHFVVAYGNVAKELKVLGHMLGIPVLEY